MSPNAPPFLALALEKPRPEEAVFPRSEWGRVSMELGALPEHLSCHMIRAPEGLVMRALCTRCGGRSEALVDLRSIEGARREAREGERDRRRRVGLAADASGEEAASFLERAQFAVEAVTAPFAHEWLPRHADCAEQAEPRRMPDRVAAFVETVTGRATERIERGQSVAAEVFLLATDGRRFQVPVPDLPPSHVDAAERRARAAEMTYALRRLVRARQLDVLAAVLVSEAWVVAGTEKGGGVELDADQTPATSPRRLERLVVCAVTPEAGHLGQAPIEREGGVMDEGPGTVGELTFHPGAGPNQLLDGILATTDAFELSEEEVRRAAGVPLGPSSN